MICLDTSALIWAFQEDRSGRKKLHDWFQALAQFGDVNKIGLPAPALAELLHGATPAEKAARMAELRKFLMVWPFDAMAAREAASVLPHSKNVPKNVVKREFKWDLAIAATAAARGAKVLIHEDAHFTGMQSLFPGLAMQIASVVPVPRNLPLNINVM